MSASNCGQSDVKQLTCVRQLEEASDRCAVRRLSVQMQLHPPPRSGRKCTSPGVRAFRSLPWVIGIWETPPCRGGRTRSMWTYRLAVTVHSPKRGGQAQFPGSLESAVQKPEKPILLSRENEPVPGLWPYRLAKRRGPVWVPAATYGAAGQWPTVTQGSDRNDRNPGLVPVGPYRPEDSSDVN